MQFRLQTLLLLFVVAWTSMAAFGPWGLAFAAYLIAMVTCIRIARVRSSRWAAFAAIILMAIFFILLTTVGSARNAYRRMACTHNCQTLALALQSYHNSHGHYPPAHTTDDEGRPMHSWRVLLTPFLEKESFYKNYNFYEPWDSPHNLALAKEMPEAFSCPSAYLSKRDATPSWTTNYVAITGPGTIWEKRTDKDGKEIGQDNAFTDDPNATILLVETVDSGIHWMEPRDLTIKEVLSGEDGLCLAATSNHDLHDGYFVETINQSRGNLIMADGAVKYCRGRITRKGLKALLTTDGGESISPDDFACHPDKEPVIRRIIWTHCIGLPLFCLSFAVLVMSTKITPKDKTNEESTELTEATEGVEP